MRKIEATRHRFAQLLSLWVDLSLFLPLFSPECPKYDRGPGHIPGTIFPLPPLSFLWFQPLSHSHLQTCSRFLSPDNFWRCFSCRRGTDSFLHQDLQTIFIFSPSLGFSTFCPLASTPQPPASPALSKAVMMPPPDHWLILTLPPHYPTLHGQLPCFPPAVPPITLVTLWDLSVQFGLPKYYG